MALQVNENIIITGDLNSNLLCSNNNKLIDLVNIFNLKNVIDKPTRISGNTSTLLDLIILSDTLNCNYSDVLIIPRHISDHDAAIAFIKCPKATSRSFTRDIWLYDQTDFVRFNQMLTDINWNEIRKEIRMRDRLRKKLLKSQNENNIIKYKKQRNKVNNMKKIAKEKFENTLDNFLSNNSSNPKMYWNSINDPIIDDIAYDDSDKCELLNKYFSSISKLDDENVTLPLFDSKTNTL